MAAPNDAMDAAGWFVGGAALLAASLTMDRLADQDVPPFAAPGLLPGLLGIALMLLAGVLLARSLRRADGPASTAPTAPPQPRSRTALAIMLCVLFGAGLVGHGLPFWAAAALFVTAAILLLRRSPAAGPGVLAAALIGLGAGAAITLVFEKIFLVRLP